MMKINVIIFSTLNFSYFIKLRVLNVNTCIISVLSYHIHLNKQNNWIISHYNAYVYAKHICINTHTHTYIYI